MSDQRNAHAAVFAQLHQGPGALTLPNIWDAATALETQRAGAAALATTSAGMAWAQGYADGNRLPPDQLVRAVSDIIRVATVPVTVDMEDGYSDDPAVVAALAEWLWEAGVVGINLEDGAGPPDLLARKIRAIRDRLGKGAAFFVNARTDVYLRSLARAGAVAEVLRRAAVYAEAGASGLFVPLIVDPGEIHDVASATRLPLNVMAVPGLAGRALLEGLGVRRLSTGSAIAQAALGLVRGQAEAFLTKGSSADIFAGTLADYGDLNTAAMEAAV